MLTVAQLRKIKAKEFEEAADGWLKVSDAAGAAKERVDNEITVKLRHGQTGDGVDAALARLRRLSGSLHYTQVECGLVRAALNGLATELRAAQKKLNVAIADAEAENFTVADDGSVHWVSAHTPVPLSGQQSTRPGNAPNLLLPATPRPDLTQWQPDRLGAAMQAAEEQRLGDLRAAELARAQEYADRIVAALKDATEADATYTRTLSRLKADNDLTTSRTDWLDAQRDMGAVRKTAGGYLEIGDIHKGKSAKENADWWKGLSADERRDYATLFPASIGALDGLPADVRDDANRTVLAEKRADYHRQLSAIPAPPEKWAVGPRGTTLSADWVAWNDKWGDKKAHLEAPLKGMIAIQDRFDATGRKGLPAAYLLGFDPEENGRAIIANGNPDTADHTAVYVPGTTSRLEAIGGDINRMTDLWKAATMTPGNPQVSTITWLGYEAPQSIVPEAMQKSWAEGGAPKLNSFLDGLQQAQGGPGASHTTLIGHSYGSTVIGQASEVGNLAADDIAVQGSPGMLVPKAGDLDVGKDHVWSQAAGMDRGLAGFDYVPAGGKLAGLGGWEWKVDTWNGVPIDIGYAQNVPSDESFGARRMTVDTDGHSGYWTPGSQSLVNQAAIVVGQYDEVELD